MLQLSCSLSLSSNHLHVHYVSSSTHVRQAKLRFSYPLLLSKIQFHELQLPPCPTTANLPPSFESSLQLRQPLAALLQTLSSQAKKLVVIHATLMSYAVQDAASLPNTELYSFFDYSAFVPFSLIWERLRNEITAPKEVEIPDNLPSLESCFSEDVLKFEGTKADFLQYRSGDIHNSCRLIEGDYIDLLAHIDHGKKMRWAVGPLNQMICNHEENNSNNRKHKCLDWLDKQPPNSMIYVSFGTQSSMESKQIKELAVGLELNKLKFIWVVGKADRDQEVFAREDGNPQLPEGFEQKTDGQGMVVRGWAPQVEILGHPSVGGFMSHCGWGSCLESISMGVPIAAWPMDTDQPRNVIVVTRVLKVGLEVREWSRREGLVMASGILEVVRVLMASEEGETIRKRAEELGKAIRHATREGGVSRLELESFIHHITAM